MVLYSRFLCYLFLVCTGEENQAWIFQLANLNIVRYFVLLLLLIDNEAANNKARSRVDGKNGVLRETKMFQYHDCRVLARKWGHQLPFQRQ
jgi:hypothetical protein